MLPIVSQSIDNSLSPATSPMNAAGFSSSLPSADASEATDAAADPFTSYTIAVGDRFDGSIGSTDDIDWVAIDLTADTSYVFSLWGTGGSTAGLDDTILTLFDAIGDPITSNDDVNSPAGNFFSLIEYTPIVSGTYYLGVSAYSGETGGYTLQAATDVYSLDQVSSQLTEFGWGIPTPIAHDERTGDTMTVNLSSLTLAGQKLATWALEAWSTATGISFVKSTSSSVDIVFDDAGSGAYGGPTSYDPNTGEIAQASVNISTAWLSTFGNTLDSISFHTYLQKIGHALGLHIAGPYDSSAAYGTDSIYRNDSYQMTVMSYFDLVENTYVSGTDSLPITPMIADVLAIEQLYGTTTAAHGGNTTWGANSNVGGYLGTLFGYLFDGVVWDPEVFGGGNVLLTIQDSGGHDTLDLSTTSAANRVLMTDERVSDINGGTGNLVIARGTVIEDVITGSGNDTVIGNAAANNIVGGHGKDSIDGGAGDDLIYAGRENDVIQGGSGQDTIRGENGRDTIDGGDGNDLIYGGTAMDRINGGDGNDTISAGSGNDRIYGDDGNDRIYGNRAGDLIRGDDGNDLLKGGSGNDTLAGGRDDDVLYGNSGKDKLNGGSGNDTLTGGAGADVFVFKALTNGEVDLITDFTDGVDVLRLYGVSGSGKSAKFAALDVTKVPGGVEVEYSSHVITLDGVSIKDIDKGDFVFL